MKALEIIGGGVTAPSTTFTPVTMASGNSNQVRSFPAPFKAYMLTAWADHQTAGYLRFTSSMLHDGNQGIRLYDTASEVQALIPLLKSPQILTSQDILSITMTGSATAGDIENFAALFYYENLPGVNAMLITPEQLAAYSTGQLSSVENTISTGTAGGWSGEEAINAEYDNFHTASYYAILGGLVSAEACAIRWRSSDFGNLGVGMPANDVFKAYQANWFVYLSEKIGAGLIPVFAGANKGTVLIDALQDENGADPLVITHYAELRPEVVNLFKAS